MTDQLLARIEKLEKQNRSMKMALLGLGLGAASLITMGHALPQNAGDSAERIEVREIVLRDGAYSARLTPRALVFAGKSGYEEEKATLNASGISMGGRYAAELKPTGLICSRDGVPRFDLSVGEIGAAMAFKNGSGNLGTMMDETTIALINRDGMLSMRPEHIFLQKGEADALLASSSLRIRDSSKFKAILGQTGPGELKAGKTGARPAASLMLLGKDDSAIWQAP